VPEIPVPTREFDGNSPSAALLRFDIHDATFALFLGEAIDDQDPLAKFYPRLHVEQATVFANRHRGGYCSERMVTRTPAVNLNGNRKRESVAATAFDHRNLH
jgi:hypothetical protein